ncbi:MAG: hypothetical protein PUP91_24745 [Rhizonema sp. PD37]|nr:hypothetical protein [Rhizonema sp. PD37]
MTFVIPNSEIVADQCQALATLVARHTESNGNLIYPTAIAQLSLSFSRSNESSLRLLSRCETSND